MSNYCVCTGTSIALSNIPMVCEHSRGGIKEIILTNYADDNFSYDSGGTITGISSSVTWYRVCVRENTSYLTGTLNIDEANDIHFYENELQVVLNKLNATTRAKLNALSYAQLSAIITDANGVHHVLGDKHPASMSASTYETGTNKTDGSKYTVTIKGDTDDIAPIISDELYATAEISES